MALIHVNRYTTQDDDWMTRVIATRCYSSRRNNQFSLAGRSSGIDRILRHTFVKSANPSSRAAACETSIILPLT